MGWITAVAFLACLTQWPGAEATGKTFTASISMEGLKATVHLTEADNGDIEVSTTDRVGFPAAIGLTVHPFWVDLGVKDMCSDEQIGPAMGGELTGTLNNNDGVGITWTNTNIETLEGKTILLTYGNKKYCGMIQQQGAYLTAHADFQDDITGTVFFRQLDSDNSEKTVILADLKSSKTFYNPYWKIIDSVDGCNNKEKLSEQAIFDPVGTAQTKIGDLQTKLDEPTVIVLPSSTSAKKVYSDEKLPLSGDSSVINKYLIIYDRNHECSTVACARIELFKERKATAMFSHEGVSGSISFQNLSPFDTTLTKVNLTGLASKAKGYHVHLFPTPVQTAQDQPLCSPGVVAGHFNPYNIQTPFPAPTVGTDDQYEIGDLSSKYGTFKDKTEVDEQYTDFNLPLFGANSILGRSLVIHRNDATNSRWICSNILPDHNVVSGVAVFTFPVIGQIYFTKNMDSPVADTWIFTSLRYLYGPATSNHQWTINNDEVGDDMTSETLGNRCMSTGQVFDLQNCTEESCKVGEMWQRHGKLYIGGDTPKKQFFTDKSLMLGSTYNILGRSITIYDSAGTNRLACATIMPLHAPKLTAKFTGSGMSGSVSFNQQAGFGARPTHISVDIPQFNNEKMLQIYSNPVSGDECTGLGLVYNPLEFAGTVGSTDDQHKIGDLSTIKGTSAKNLNLPLSGLTSIRYRSLVIKETQSNKIIACGNIQEPFSKDFGGYQVSAILNFDAPLKGTINLYQVLYMDGGTSDTTAVVNLESLSTQSFRHNWHVHKYPVMFDSNTDSGRCSSAGPHYDPFMAMKGSAQAKYGSECNSQNPLRCELGDLSKKLAQYSLGQGTKVYTDINLPLNGMYRVQGRSIVLHVADGGAPRFACANIIPIKGIQAVEVTFETPTPPEKFDLLAVEKIYTAAINIKRWEMAIELIASNPTESTIKVHFLGLDRDINRGKFLAYFGNDENRKTFGVYAPMSDPNSVGNVSMSVALLVMTLLINFLF